MSISKYIPEDKIIKIEENMPHLTAGVWRLCWETGVRVSDAVKAKYSDFDDHNKFHYTAQKTGKRGVATVSSYFIDTYIGKSRPRKYVFRSPRRPGKHITRQAVFNHVKQACERAGIDSAGISPHSARKHFAVELFHDKGLGATMSALQHREVGTTLLYALSDDALHDVIVRLRKLEKQMERVFDELFGDDVYIPTQKGILESKKRDSKNDC